MSDKKAEKTATPQRIPADQLLLNFLKENDIVLIVDEAQIVTNTIKGIVYTVDKRPRVRVQYQDELKKEDQPTNGNQTPTKPEISVES